MNEPVPAGLPCESTRGILPAVTFRRVKGASPIAEPHPPLSGGAFSGPVVPLSPDPLSRYRWRRVRPSDGLQVYLLGPVAVAADPAGSFEGVETATTAHCCIEVSAPGSLRFDFGVESAGWLEFDSPDLTGSVEMSISEYNEPAIVNEMPEHRIKTLAPVRYGQTCRLELNKELFEGVRFGWIHVRSWEKRWHVRAVRLVCQAKPTNYAGSFSCSDPMLTRIWYTGAYGVRINLLKDYFAALPVDRGDRFSWTGDAHPSQAAALVAFDVAEFVRSNLERTATDANGIETYALYWILSLVDYYRHTGDAATLEKFMANVRAKLEHGNAIYEAPPIGFCGWDERLGAGFSEADQPETRNVYRMLFIRACREFAWAMGQAGQTARRDTYLEMAARREVELRQNACGFEPWGLHALADAVNAGCATAEEQEWMFRREFRDRVNRLSFSSFNEYFVIQALARMGRHDEALASVRDHWGGQVAYGGTTFFETFRPEWNAFLGPNDAPPNGQSGYTSLAHAWGGGVVAWLTREVLGITPTAPGFSRLDIRPHLGLTLTWVEGGVPTPHGVVGFRLDVAAGTGEVDLPEGCVARVCLPQAGRRIEAVRVNGKVAWDGRFQAIPGVGGGTATTEFIELLDVQPGRYTLKIAYIGATEKYKDIAWIYPLRFSGADSTTGGNWGGGYGRAGHVLFGYDGADRDRARLPGYVESITLSPKCRRIHLGSPGRDTRILAPDAGNGWPRNIGGIMSTNPAWEGVTMTVDIALRSSATFRLSLYFVDWDRLGRRQVVEVLDLRNRKLLAPPQMVRSFEQGRYLMLECDRSIRLRINHVRGENAVLNGLFFDPATGPQRD